MPPSFANCPGFVPKWMLASIETSFDKTLGEQRDGCVRVEPAVGGAIRPEPPNYDGPAVPIARRDAVTLTPAQFYWDFMREGLPVVITGFFDRDPAFWAAHIAKVDAAARAKFARLSAERVVDLADVDVVVGCEADDDGERNRLDGLRGRERDCVIA